MQHGGICKGWELPPPPAQHFCAPLSHRRKAEARSGEGSCCRGAAQPSHSHLPARQPASKRSPAGALRGLPRSERFGAPSCRPPGRKVRRGPSWLRSHGPAKARLGACGGLVKPPLPPVPHTPQGRPAEGARPEAALPAPGSGCAAGSPPSSRRRLAARLTLTVPPRSAATVPATETPPRPPVRHCVAAAARRAARTAPAAASLHMSSLLPKEAAGEEPVRRGGGEREAGLPLPPSTGAAESDAGPGRLGAGLVQRPGARLLGDGWCERGPAVQRAGLTRQGSESVPGEGKARNSPSLCSVFAALPAAGRFPHSPAASSSVPGDWRAVSEGTTPADRLWGTGSRCRGSYTPRVLTPV